MIESRSKESEVRTQTRNRHSEALDRELVERQVRICKAFANVTRLRLLDQLGHGPQTASELQQELDVSKANLSQHLAILKAAGVVTTRRDGKQLICSLALPEVKTACHLIRDVLRAQIQRGRQFVI